MRVLSLSEFQDWHRMANPQEYIFASDNQADAERRGPRASLYFSGLFVSPEIRQICFTGSGRNALFFDRVKEVHMFDDVKTIGVILDILCGEQEPRRYRFLAD